jgi:Cu2+-exporting ATPase
MADHQGHGAADAGEKPHHEMKGHGDHGGPGPSRPTNGKGDHGGHASMMADYWRRFIVSMVLTVPILVLSPMIQEWFGYSLEFPGSLLLLFALSTVVYLYGGWPFLKGLVRELSDRRPGMMTLVGLAISVAYFYSSASVFGTGSDILFWELATLIDIMLLGHIVEMRSVMGASRALEELAKVMPSSAHLVVDGGTREVQASELRIGDQVLVKPGEKVPADGVVRDGSSHVDESLLTGESMPQAAAEGREVIGGSVNGEGSLVVEVQRTGEETYLSQVIEVVRKAQESRSRTQNLADRAAMFLVIVAVSAGILTFVAWTLLGDGASFAVERAVTVMVISCPHALGLAIPLVVAVSTALAAGSGFLVRERQAFEEARGVRSVIFDKTGTLTEGRLGATNVLAYGSRSEAEVLAMAAAVEASSEHPIAAAIGRRAAEENLKVRPVEGFKAVAGRGVEGLVDGKKVEVMGPGPLREMGLAPPDGRAEELASRGRTVVFIVAEGAVAGAVVLADVVRAESREAVARLKGMGIRCLMLTGDNKFVAKAVAEDLGLDEYYAEVLPNDKAEVVKRVQGDGPVAMVGDGINDAPALVQADVGIAIGSGTDVAIGSADIVLVRNDPRDVAEVLSLSRRTYSKMRQNLVFATGYNAVAIPLAAGVLSGFGIVLSPAMGAVLMSASTILVAINARLLR